MPTGRSAELAKRYWNLFRGRCSHFMSPCRIGWKKDAGYTEPRKGLKAKWGREQTAIK
jgi:hypothetical protein